jgi:hypothetical protein
VRSFVTCTTNIFLVNKSRRMRLARHVARKWERRGAWGILFWKPEGKRIRGRYRIRWETIFEWILQKSVGRAWTGLIWLRIGIIGELLSTP